MCGTLRSAMTLHYHYFPTSHWSRVISLVIAEKGIPVERHMVDIRHNASFDPDYLRVNPKGVVPTLVDDGQNITNALKIVAYLDAHHQGPPLYTGLGDDAVERWVRELEAFPTMLFSYAVWVKGLKGEKSGDILDDKVSRARTYAVKFPDLKTEYLRKAAFFEKFRAQVHDPEHVSAELSRCRPIVDEMGTAVSKSTWLAGETYSLADAIATAVLYRLCDLNRLDHWKEDTGHGLHGYYERLCARPSFAPVFRDDPLMV